MPGGVVDSRGSNELWKLGSPFATRKGNFGGHIPTHCLLKIIWRFERARNRSCATFPHTKVCVAAAAVRTVATISVAAGESYHKSAGGHSQPVRWYLSWSIYWVEWPITASISRSGAWNLSPLWDVSNASFDAQKTIHIPDPTTQFSLNYRGNFSASLLPITKAGDRCATASAVLRDPGRTGLHHVGPLPFRHIPTLSCILWSYGVTLRGTAIEI